MGAQSQMKRGKMRVTKQRLDSVLFLIGWKEVVNFIYMHFIYGGKSEQNNLNKRSQSVKQFFFSLKKNQQSKNPFSIHEEFSPYLVQLE